MSRMSKREYLIALKGKYRKASRLRKSQLLDDFCEFTNYHRKYALDLINKPLPKLWKRYQPRQKYYDQPTKDALLILWRAANEICGERLHPFIPELMTKLIACSELMIGAVVERKLKEISLATVKRIIRISKRRSLIKLGTTRPGSLLKSQIAVRYGQWTETEPGWCETDTVAHCGSEVSGEFIYSLNLINIATGWSEQGAIWGKGERATTLKMDKLRQRLPFPLRGLDPDNGSEFINWQLHRYCQKNGINLTRCRPYHKNDQAHIEQKNYTAVRQLVGWSRLDKKEQLTILNDLYVNEWRLYLNFFQPTLKLKERIKNTQTGRTKKRYFEAKTPYQRLLEHPNVPAEQKTMLQSIYDSLNPIELQQKIKQKLELLRNTPK